jgi:hypothetical protein
LVIAEGAEQRKENMAEDNDKLSPVVEGLLWATIILPALVLLGGILMALVGGWLLP